MDIHLDFETYSEADIKAVGAIAYCRHPSTEVLCLAYRGLGPVQTWVPAQPNPAQLIAAIVGGATMVGWNVGFEACILELLERIRKWPRATRFRDTAAIAMTCGLPAKLALAAGILGGAEQQKDKEGKRLLDKFSKPQKKGPRRILPADAPGDFAALLRYCAQDVVAEEAVARALPIVDLPPFEREMWAVDRAINSRGVRLDMPLVRGALKLIDRSVTESAAEIARLTGGAVTSPGQVARIVEFAHANGYKGMPTARAEDVRRALADSALPRVVRRVLEVRVRASRTSTKKYPRMAEAADPADGRVRGTMLYAGAHTLRWAGRIIQVQNLPRPKADVMVDRELFRNADWEALTALYSDPMSALRDAIRGTLIAAEGHAFLVADEASIEARILGWVAGEPKYMDAFRKGRDLYIVSAADTFSTTYEAVLAEYVAGDTYRRAVGKESVLGLGYGMGFDTFKATCAKKGLKIDDGILRRAVTSFRKGFPAIPRFWRDLEVAAVAAVATGKPQTVTKLRVEMVKGFLTILLPSGRRLWYPEASLENRKTAWGDIRRVVTFKTLINSRLWLRGATYGGRLVENVVQAIARDTMAEALVKLERRGYSPVFHIHDEVVCEVPQASLDAGHHSLDYVKQLLSTPPAWGKDLCLGASGFISTYYKK